PTATPMSDSQHPTPTPPEAEATPRPEDIRKALEDLGDALKDQASSSQAGEALSRGDTAGAAEALRRLADQVGGLSSQAKQGLAEAMRQGAGQSGAVPDLERALHNGAQALESGDDQAAAQALEDLAGTVDKL